MMNLKHYLFMCCIALNVFTANAQSWVPVGSTDFSDRAVGFTSIAETK